MASSDTTLFVEKYLKSTYPGIQIKTLVESAGSKPGDNVAGVLKAVKVIADIDGKEKTFDFVCKNSSDDPEMEFLNSSGAFRREVDMYSKVIPDLVQFQKENGVVDPVKVQIPELFHSCVDTKGELDRILLQDMRALGYKMADKFVGLSSEETMLALPEIAKLHALSFAMKTITRKSLKETFPLLELGDGFDFFIDEIKNYYREATMFVEELGEIEIATRMKKLFGKEIDLVRSATLSPISDPLTVICHNDFWLNNMLFKYDENDKPVKISVIDFQFSTTTSIMFDIIYFLYTSTSVENRKHHLKTWLKCYHDTFIGVINKFKDLKRPENFEFIDFEKLFRSFLPFAVVHICYALPFQQSDGAVLTEAMKIVESPDNPDHGAVAARMLLRSGKVKEMLLPFLREMVEEGAI